MFFSGDSVQGEHFFSQLCDDHNRLIVSKQKVVTLRREKLIGLSGISSKGYFSIYPSFSLTRLYPFF